MTCAPTILAVRMRFRWWLELYVHGVIFFALLFDAEPDLAKVLKRMNEATIIEVFHRGRWKRMA